MKNNIYVVNLRGEKEPFSFHKVYQSARSVGASEELALEIAKRIESEAFSGILTSQIFDRVFQLLLEKSPKSAIRFNLRKSIEKLGPSGFSFEKFVGKIFEAEGFEVKLNQIILGFCTSYEIDFLARKGNLVYIGECKFHHFPGGKIDLQVALANYARFLDIKKGKFLNSKVNYKSILVTNTKFTEKTIKYSVCVGVELLGWKYPKGKGLEFLIEKNRLYPITILPSVSQFLANKLIDCGFILVKDILKREFQKLKVDNKTKIIKEAEILLKK